MTAFSFPPERSLASGRLAARRTHLVAELRRQPARRRRQALIAVPALALLLAATAWTTHRLTKDVSHFESIGCYDRTGLDWRVAVQGAEPGGDCASLGFDQERVVIIPISR